jgi:hypothetical protein
MAHAIDRGRAPSGVGVRAASRQTAEVWPRRGGTGHNALDPSLHLTSAMTYRSLFLLLAPVTALSGCGGAAQVKLRPYEKVTVVNDDGNLGDAPFEYSTLWERCELLGFAAVDAESRSVSTSDLSKAQADVQSGKAAGECVVLCRGTRYVAKCGALTLGD